MDAWSLMQVITLPSLCGTGVFVSEATRSLIWLLETWVSKCFRLIWTSMFCFMFALWSQWGHLNGFSPEWVIRCLFKRYLRLMPTKRLLHISQCTESEASAEWCQAAVILWRPSSHTLAPLLWNINGIGSQTSQQYLLWPPLPGNCHLQICPCRWNNSIGNNYIFGSLETVTKKEMYRFSSVLIIHAIRNH